MKILLKICALLIIGLLAIYTIGCGEDVEQEIDPVAFVNASPQIGSKIAEGDTITLTFNRTPVEVSVSAGATATVRKTVASGKTVTIHGPFELGELNLTVTWRDGTTTLTYTVTETPRVDPSQPIINKPIVTGAEPIKPIATDGKPVTVTDATFEAVVLNAEMPVVVELGADW